MAWRLLQRGPTSDLLRGVAFWAAVVALFGSIGAAAGALSLPDPADAEGPPGPIVFGREPADPAAPPEEEARRIARLFGQAEVTLRADGFERRMSRERLGIRADQAEVQRLIEAWRSPGSPLRRYRSRAGLHGSVAVPVPLRVDADAAFRALLGLKEDFDVQPADAHIDLDARRVVPERVGRRLDVTGTIRRLERASRAMAEEVDLEVVTVVPAARAAELKQVEFGHVIGWFETPYSRQAKVRDRTYNLALAARSLHGHVLMPGDLFSFNDVVGERSEARGYRVATVIASGELVDGMGGGTCQIAGTLHAAAFFAGLEIVDRSPHSRPSAYIRVGLDATVSYPNIDLKLRNPFPFPVVLGMTVRDGKVRGEVLGPERELTVTYIRTILETSDPPSRTIEDDTLPRGVKVVTQRGVPGFKIRRFRIFQKGSSMWREESVDRYPPVVRIVRVGTNQALDPDAEGVPQEDPHGVFPMPCNMRIAEGPGDLFEEQTACH